VQGLRAAAALSVAFNHIAHDAIVNGTDPDGAIAAIFRFLPWGAGVDIFFVISGFIIVHASASLFGTGAQGAGTFLRRRLARIVPLYWIMTFAFLAVLWAGRGAIHGAIGGPAYIAASFLFLPWPRPDGLMEPALGLGWTLNYEMFFYAVFALFIALPRHRALACVGFVLGLFVLAGQSVGFATPQLTFWSNPIILEFCAGMGLAQLLAAGVGLPVWLRLGLPLLAITALHFAPDPGASRAAVWGIPAVLLVAAAALAPIPATLSRPARAVVRLGDASYALYLVHPFVMRFLSVFWHKIHAHHELAGTIYVAVGLVVAQLCALGLNLTLERRMGALLRRRNGVTHEVVQMPELRPDGVL
jgi:peptidoglycan/LPS O-acetylase OafA/YrhL